MYADVVGTSQLEHYFPLGRCKSSKRRTRLFQVVFQCIVFLLRDVCFLSGYFPEILFI